MNFNFMKKHEKYHERRITLEEFLREEDELENKNNNLENSNIWVKPKNDLFSDDNLYSTKTNELFDEIINTVFNKVSGKIIRFNSFDQYTTDSEYFEESDKEKIKKYLQKYFECHGRSLFKNKKTYDKLSYLFRELSKRTRSITSYNEFISCGGTYYKSQNHKYEVSEKDKIAFKINEEYMKTGVRNRDIDFESIYGENFLDDVETKDEDNKVERKGSIISNIINRYNESSRIVYKKIKGYIKNNINNREENINDVVYNLENDIIDTPKEEIKPVETKIENKFIVPDYIKSIYSSRRKLLNKIKKLELNNQDNTKEVKLEILNYKKEILELEKTLLISKKHDKTYKDKIKESKKIRKEKAVLAIQEYKKLYNKKKTDLSLIEYFGEDQIIYFKSLGIKYVEFNSKKK